ncbi:hypothetical protein BDV18DRAFT_145092 [Aspergillus unguis]
MIDLTIPDTPYEPAPASPYGPPLLNDNETNMLDDFFTTINTADPFPPDFWLPDTHNDPNVPDLQNLDWPTDLPPTFAGSATSLPPPPPSFSHQSSEKPFGIAPEHSNHEVMAAASMLYQNGLSPGINTTFTNQPRAFSSVDYSQFKVNGKEGHQNGHLPPRRTSAPCRTHLPVAHHTSMFMNVHQPISPEQQLTAKAQPLHWGSDSSFMDRGYVAPPEQPDEEQRTKELMENLECLEPQSSAANTRAPTPDRRVNAHSVPWVELGTSSHTHGRRKDYGDSIEEYSYPKKKQRLSIKEEEDDASEGDSTRQRSKRSKQPSRRLSNDAIRKSRPSQSSKASRENLTEEQKRSNHIHSEQKRRNLIKQGFDDLCTLVPGLRGGGFSKSAVLTQAADWLEDILRGNNKLKMQLAELDTMPGYMISQ